MAYQLFTPSGTTWIATIFFSYCTRRSVSGTTARPLDETLCASACSPGVSIHLKNGTARAGMILCGGG